MTSKKVGFPGFVSVTVFLFCLIGLATTTRAQQNTADVVGTVTDASGAVVPGATVTITNIGTNVSSATTTGGSGDYAFTLLQVGTYAVKIEAKGFKTYTVPSVALSSGDRAREDAKLEVGDVSQTVEVSGTTTPALQTDTSSLGTLVTTQAVENVPLNGRNVTKLIQLSAGVAQGTTNSIVSGTRPDDRRQTAAFSVNGQSDSINNNLLNGMDNNERIIGGNVARPSIDAIQEVNVSTNLYDASVGRTGGGVVDIVTKSGSNDFHGSAYEFFRNKVLNTNPGYSFPSSINSSGVESFTKVPPNPAFRQNQYGASIGGPLKKNKTFFFGDYEAFKQALGLPFTQISVPTACERGTKLATLQAAAEHVSAPSAACPDGTTPTLPGDFSDLQTISASGGSSSSPSSGSPGPNLSGLAMCTAANNSKGGCISPQGLAFFSIYPLPNGTGTVNNYTSTGASTRSTWTVDGRVDQHFSDKNTLFGTYTINASTVYTPSAFPNVTIDPTTDMVAASGGSGVPIISGAVCCGVQFPGSAKERQQALGLSFVHVFNPNVVLNLKFGLGRSAITSLDTNYGTNAAKKLGFACNTTANSVSPQGNCMNEFAGASGIPAINLNVASPANGTSITTPSYTGFGDASFLPILEYDTSFDYMGMVTWNKGAHSIRMGLSLIRRRATIGQNNFGNGQFTFNGAYTGVPAADLLEGLSVGQPGSQSINFTLYQPGFRMWEPSTYIQDDWRVKRWLTLNLGLRYDIFTPYTEVHGRSTNYNQYTGLVIGPAIPGAQQSGSTMGIKTDYNSIAPRFGFSASLPHEIVLRGGFGISHFPINYQSGYNLKNAPANYQYECGTQQVNGSQNACTGTTFDSGATANYGTLPTSGSSSNVGQVGGYAFGQGLPVPFENVNQIFAPSASVCKYSGTLKTYATDCPSSVDPYQTFSLGNIQAFNVGPEYLEQMNLQMQKAFGQNVITIGGVAELGRHAPKTIALNGLSNPTQVVNGSNNPPLGFEFPWLAKTTVNQITTTASDAYTGLQMTFVRRFSKGLTAQANYTWAHALTYYGGSCTPTMSRDASNNLVDNYCLYDNVASPSNPYKVVWFNRGANGGRSFSTANSGVDVADRIGWTVNYQLPFGNSLTGVAGAVVKGWSANLGGFWQTGLPFTVGENATNINGIGGTGNPDETCSGKLSNPTLTEWFNPACFHSQTPGTFGNEEGNQLFGPTQKNMDFSLFKNFQLRENLQMQFRTEVFNLFNTPNFNVPSNITVQYTGCTVTVNTCTGNANSATNGLTGAITGLNPNQNSRQIQFAVKFLF